MDIRTFAERKDKPYILPDRATAFEVFQPRMTGLIMDCLYQIFKAAHSTYNPVIKRVLDKTQSTDDEYLNKVIATSLQSDAEAKALIKKVDEEKRAEEKK